MIMIMTVGKEIVIGIEIMKEIKIMIEAGIEKDQEIMIIVGAILTVIMIENILMIVDHHIVEKIIGITIPKILVLLQRKDLVQH